MRVRLDNNVVVFFFRGRSKKLARKIASHECSTNICHVWTQLLCSCRHKSARLEYDDSRGLKFSTKFFGNSTFTRLHFIFFKFQVETKLLSVQQSNTEIFSVLINLEKFGDSLRFWLEREFRRVCLFVLCQAVSETVWQVLQTWQSCNHRGFPPTLNIGCRKIWIGRSHVQAEL